MKATYHNENLDDLINKASIQSAFLEALAIYLFMLSTGCMALLILIHSGQNPVEQSDNVGLYCGSVFGLILGCVCWKYCQKMPPSIEALEATAKIDWCSLPLLHLKECLKKNGRLSWKEIEKAIYIQRSCDKKQKIANNEKQRCEVERVILEKEIVG